MKVLIIGCGSIGCRHARINTEVGKHQIVLCDSNPKQLEPIAQELGITETYSDMDVAIRESHADAAIICLPNHLHAAPTIAALKAGMDVLCEKPIATSLEDARKMVETAKECGRKLMVGYTLRSTARIRKAKEIIDSGKLGRIVAARVVLTAPETLTFARSPFRAKYETGGGIIYDYTHQLDYCRYFFGDAKRCFAFVSSRMPELPACDDNAEGIVDYGDLTVNYHWDYIQWQGKTTLHTTIVGDKGALDILGMSHVVVSYNDGTVEDYELAFDHERNNSFKHQMDKFVAFCETGEPNGVCTGEDAYEDLRLATLLYQSSAEGRMLDV